MTEDLGDRLEPALSREELPRRRRCGPASASGSSAGSGARSGASGRRRARRVPAGRRRRRERPRHPRRRRRAARVLQRVPHRGAELVDSCADACGSFGSAIRCPYHSWTYGLDGPLRRAPFLGAVSDADAAAFALAPVGVDTWGGFVFVNLAPDAGDVAASTSSATSPGASRRYPLDRRPRRRARHVRGRGELEGARGELQRVLPLRPGAPGAVRARPVVPARAVATTSIGSAASPTATARTRSRRPARRRARRSPASTRTSSSATRASSRYPNLLLSLSCDHVAVVPAARRAAPGTRRSCATCCSIPTRSRDPDFDPSDAFDFWDVVNRQDWAICESVQRGHGARVGSPRAGSPRWRTRASTSGPGGEPRMTDDPRR